MRANPRYSIIPAGAVTDRQLEGRDLHVLCLLGCHSDKLGWCEASSQAALAALIDVSRQTFQRSIARLIKAGWVQARTMFVSEGGRPYAPYAYRVIMDRDDQEILPQGFEVAAATSLEGAHGWAPLPTGGQGVPIAGGQGCPRMHGHQESDQARDQELEVESRAREPLVSDGATNLAWQIAALAGLPDVQNLPPGWCGAPMRVQQFLSEGFHPEMMLLAAREVMAGRKTKDVPWSIEYFAKAFVKVAARHKQPLPVAEIQSEPEKVIINAKPPNGIRGALDKLRADIADEERQAEEGGSNIVRLLPDGRRA